MTVVNASQGSITTRVGRALRTAVAQPPNPVLVKELRARFRGPRAFGVLTIFLLFLAATAFSVYATQAVFPSYYGGTPYYPDLSSRSAEIGRGIFTGVSIVEYVLVALIAPALAFGSISGEIEKQTYELLLATPLTAGSIVRGKILAALSFVGLLVAAALPILSIAFLFGGVSAESLLLSQLVTVLLAVEFVAVGTFFSALMRRTSRAAIVTYVAILAFSIVLPWFTMMSLMLIEGINGPDELIGLVAGMAMLANPFGGVVGVYGMGDFGGVTSLTSAALQLLFSGTLIVVTPSLIRAKADRGRGKLLAALLVGFVIWIFAALIIVDTYSYW